MRRTTKLLWMLSGGLLAGGTVTPSWLIGPMGRGTTSPAIWDNPYHAGY